VINVNSKNIIRHSLDGGFMNWIHPTHLHLLVRRMKYEAIKERDKIGDK